MINRVLIRLKVLQVVYAYYQNGGRDVNAAEKELMFSLSKAYDLYHYLLLLIVAVTQYAAKRIEIARGKLSPTPEDLNPNMKFVDNRLAAQIEANEQLRAWAGNGRRTWADDEDFVRGLYEQIQQTDTYQDYMSSGESSFDQDRELWRRLYKTLVCANPGLDALLEDKSLYWNDDKDIVDTFVIKTIKRLDPALGAQQPLLPQFKDEDDREFARRLLRRALLEGDAYRSLIAGSIRNWDMERVAFMDIIIMQCALAEIMSFPNIPISVSLNEYVEMAKTYSTPKSGAFVNGTLDNVVKSLQSQGKLLKK